jgi:RNA polymerase sigma factor (sigma-70 family)
MQPSPTDSSAEPRAPLSEPSLEETVSRQIISSYRERLEWLLRIPELEAHFAEGLEALELPGPRKGIGLRPALNALLIENKHALIRWVLRRFRSLFPSCHAKRLCTQFGLDLFNSLDLDEHLTARQWLRLQGAMLFALSKEHRRYKHAQALLFFNYQGVIDRTVNRIVFDPAKRRDCVQEGCLALLHAIDKVDTSKTSLGAYAQMWIRRQVKNYMMGERFPVHVPINLASKTLRHNSEVDAKAKKPDEQVERKMVVLMEQLRQPSISLNDVYDESGSLAEQIPDEEATSPRSQIMRKDLHELVALLIEGLTDKQREVLELRYGLNGHGDGKTLAEISRSIGISHQQVSMREKRALEKLEGVLGPYLSEIFA